MNEWNNSIRFQFIHIYICRRVEVNCFDCRESLASTLCFRCWFSPSRSVCCCCFSRLKNIEKNEKLCEWFSLSCCRRFVFLSFFLPFCVLISSRASLAYYEKWILDDIGDDESRMNVFDFPRVSLRLIVLLFFSHSCQIRVSLLVCLAHCLPFFFSKSWWMIGGGRRRLCGHGIKSFSFNIGDDFEWSQHSSCELSSTFFWISVTR